MQVYLAADDSTLLAQLAVDTGLSKAEVLRRGVRSFAREAGVPSPMLRFMERAGAGEWGEPVGPDHDAVLAEEYAPRRGTRR